MNTLTEFHKKYIYIIACIILLSSALLIGLNFYSIKILSSIRAYVNAESEYSKGQKNATRFLIEYIETSDIRDYQEFKKELSVPIGDSIARVTLLKKGSYKDIERGLLQGKNHVDDIDNMIWLFRNFRNFPYVKDAIAEWKAADSDIKKLDDIGRYILELNHEKLLPGGKAALKSNVNTINRRLTNKQQNFSAILGEASRLITYWLLFINIFFILLILFSAGIYARNMFKQLVESQKLILAQNNAKDEFLSIASHELKTPLTSMKASLQILERFSRTTPEAQKIHPFIVNSNKQADRLNNLVRDLLDVTRISNGKLAMQKEQFRINELIREVVAEKSSLETHKFIIEELDEAMVEADPDRIYQVFENFLSNALKYSAGSELVHIYSKVSNGSIKICVKDFGPGISQEKIPHLFDRFYRIEETKHSVQGLGLGLYICKEIIKNHNGEIGAESEIGKGSTFWFTLPLAA